MFRSLVYFVLLLTFVEHADVTTSVIEYKKSLSKIRGLTINNMYPNMNSDIMKTILNAAPPPSDPKQLLDRDDEIKLKHVIGVENMDLIKQNIVRRRRTSNKNSAAGRRRDQLQNIRRGKLKSQSLRSHAAHIKKNHNSDAFNIEQLY